VGDGATVIVSCCKGGASMNVGDVTTSGGWANDTRGATSAAEAASTRAELAVKCNVVRARGRMEAPIRVTAKWSFAGGQQGQCIPAARKS
jgi:hypothetical protein